MRARAPTPIAPRTATTAVAVPVPAPAGRRGSAEPLARGSGPLAAPRDPARAGDLIGRHLLLAELGRGGMGQVFAAHDAGLDRLVAIKLISLASPAMVARFLTEARATARCTHPNIVVVHEIAEHQGTPYLVLEHLAGAPLSLHLEGGALPVERVISVMLGVARALACAHSHGIVHRDLKPSNIVLAADGTAKVLDFGIALYTQEGGADAAGVAAGTPAYMAPEQLAGGPVDARADLWAFGLVLQQLLTGEHPFGGMRSTERAAAIGALDRRAPRLSARGLRGPRRAALEDLIARCLEPRVERRLACAGELVAALSALAPPARPGARLARRPAAAVLAACALALPRGAPPPAPARPEERPAIDPELAQQLERVDREAARLFTAGDRGAAAQVLDAFLARPEHAPARAEAWLRRADRELASRALEPALEAYASAYVAARGAAEAARAVHGIAEAQRGRRQWGEVGRALAALSALAPARRPPAELGAELALATRRGAGGHPAEALLAGAPRAGAPEAAVVVAVGARGERAVIEAHADHLAAHGPRGAQLWRVPARLRAPRMCAARVRERAFVAVASELGSSLFEVTAASATLLAAVEPARSCALVDLDADGTPEVYLGGGRALISYRAAAGGRWTRGELPVGSQVTALAAADLDGDGRPELAVAAGEWRAYDVRVLAASPHGLALVDRIRIGRVSALAALRAGPERGLVLVARKDPAWPNARSLPAEHPSGAPNGYYALRLARGKLAIASFLAADIEGHFAGLVAADLDGDGRDEALASEPAARGRLAALRVLTLGAGARLAAATLEGVAALAAGQLDADPAHEVIAGVAPCAAAACAWWLGVGSARLPALALAPAVPVPAPPAALGEGQRVTWRRAAELAELGATQTALTTFEELAITVPARARAAVRSAIAELRRARGEPVGIAHEASAAASPPGSREELAALWAAHRAHAAEGAFSAAAALAPRLASHPALAVAERARVDAELARTTMARTAVLTGEPLGPSWSIADPLAARHDALARALQVEAVGDERIASLPLARTRGPIGIEVQATLTRGEWASGVGIWLRPIVAASRGSGADAPREPGIGIAVRAMGGAGSYRIEAHHRDLGAIELAPHPAVDAAVEIHLRLTVLPETGELAWELRAGDRARRGRAPGPAVAARDWILEVRSDPEAGRIARMALAIARIDVAGLAPAPAAAATHGPAERAYLALTNGDHAAAREAAARDPRATTAQLVEAIAALRRGARARATRALREVYDSERGQAGALVRFARLARIDDGAHLGPAAAAVGGDRVALLALAFGAALFHHDGAELRRGAVEQLGDAALLASTSDEAELVIARATQRASMGDRAGAERDLALLVAALRGRADDRMALPRGLLLRARLAAQRGDRAAALAALAASLAESPTPELVADRVLADPLLAPLADAPALARVRLLGRVLAQPPPDAPAR
jgi:hypothetical protein